MPAKDSTAKRLTVSVPRVGYFANRNAASRRPYRVQVPKCPSFDLDDVFTGSRTLPKKRYRAHAVAALCRMEEDDNPHIIPESSPIDDWLWASGFVQPIQLNMSDYFARLEFRVTPKGDRWLAENKDAVRRHFAPRIEQAKRELAKMQAACA